MPAIWNIGNANEPNNKKVSSKLTFEVGESFKGKIISKGEGNEVVIKLTDGWQFTAEIEGKVNPQDEGLVRFEVEDFQGGKIKLKIMPSVHSQQSSEGNIIGDFMEKTGMTKENLDILKTMVKYNLPLTKENITFIKSVIAFNGKINSNPEEIDNFINKFIAGKGIEAESAKGQEIKAVLNDFFKSFKTVNKEDILFFIENNIDINKENIDSYNKLFKSETTIKEYFDNISKSFKELTLELTEGKTTKEIIKEALIENNNTKTLLSNILGKEIDISEAGLGKIRDSITPGELNIIEKSIDIIKENSNLTDAKAIQPLEEKASLGGNELASKTYDSNSVDKGKVSMLSLLKSMVGNDVELIKENIKEVLVDNKNKFTTSEFNDKLLKLNSLSEKELIDIVKTSLGDRSNVTNNDIKTLISNILGKKIDMPEVELQKTKDIIIFQMNDTELTNTKEDSVEGSKNLLKDGASQRGGTIEEAGKSTINEANIKGAEKEIKDSIAKEILKLSSTDIIKEDIKVKIENMKDVIKNIIAHAELKGAGMEKVMEFIKGNISDFKLLNSVNNEYYYLDVPVKSNGEEYPCKLIIKDSRKDSKKIDTTNIKMIVAVRTINLGTVDGYLKVNGTNLNVNIECDEEFVKTINKTKEKLLEGLKALGFFTSITVTPKRAEISLATCRGFFEESHDRAIDIKV